MRQFEKTVSGIRVQLGTNAAIVSRVIAVINGNRRGLRMVFPFLNTVNFRIAQLEDDTLGQYRIAQNLVTIAPIARKDSEILETLSHEMVHAEQVYRGTMAKNAIGIIWNGKQYDNTIPYNLRPWEIEAKKRQAKIAALIKTL